MKYFIKSYRRAFTLIELLVVIAIIAILAAILFPVFAQAKLAAKKSASVSNMKQLSLGLIMYGNDAEDVFPYANPIKDDATGQWEDPGGWWGPGWVFKTQPYIKNYGIFLSPGDASTTGGGWVRPGLSYAANAYIDDFWDGKFGAMNIGGDWQAWVPKPTASAIGRPSDTILIAERHNSAYKAVWSDGQGIQGNAPFAGVNWLDSWLGPAEIPDGSSTESGAQGPNGTVLTVWGNVANFAFVDGHVRSLNPIASDPSKWGQPDKNMWDGSRK